MMSTQFQQNLTPPLLCPHASRLAFTPRPNCGHPQKFQLCQAKVSAFIKTESPILTVLFMKYTLSWKKTGAFFI